MKRTAPLLWLGLCALVFTACSEEEAEQPCGGFCPVEECVDNMCVRTRTIVDMMVPPDASTSDGVVAGMPSVAQCQLGLHNHMPNECGVPVPRPPPRTTRSNEAIS